MQDLFEDLLNKKSKNIFFDGKWRETSQFKELINQLESQRIKNSHNEVRNSIDAKEDNALNYIEYYLKIKNKSLNSIEGIQLAREQKIPLWFLPNSNLYEYALIRYINKTVFKPAVSGYKLMLASDSLVDVIREVIDYNENGYITRVIPSNEFKDKFDYYKTKIKDSNSILTIGDCFKSSLNPLLPEYNHKKQIVGFYSECMANPIHSNFKGIDNFYNSSYCRVFAFLKPYLCKSRYFSLKIVDKSPFNNTIILPNVHIKNSNGIDGDTVFIQVFSTYYKNNCLYKYGDAKTKYERFEEYILWQLNNHFFLRYDLKQNFHTYEEMLKKISDESFHKLLKQYCLATNPEELEHLIINDGEQNNGVIFNKILSIYMAILYNN